MEYEATIEVHAAASLTDAHLLRIFLEQSGVPASVVGPLNQGAHAGFPAELESIPTVRVAVSDKARALYAVREWEQRRASARAASARAASARDEPVPSAWRGPARVLAVFVAYFLGQIAGGVVAILLGASMAGSALVGMVGGLLATIGAVRFCFGSDGPEKMRLDLGIVGVGPAAITKAVLVGLGLALLWVVIFAWLLPASWGTPSHWIDDIAAESQLGLALSALLAVVLAPLVEELLFRGAMLHGFRQRCCLRTSVGLMALTFAALHIGSGDPYWPGVVFTGVSAVVLAVLRLRSGSLVPAIVAHATYNAVWLAEFVL